MNFFVHPTAIVHPKAILRQGVWIGPKVVIKEGAVIGAYSVIGSAPEHSKFYDDVDCERTYGVIIDEGCRVFEFVTIHAGTEAPTILSANSAVFQHSHISHDCFLGKGVTVAGRSSLAGFVDLGTMANVGAHSIIHQHCVIGAYAMIGMGSVLKSHVPPAETWVGYPARHAGFNQVGLTRAGYKEVSEVIRDFGRSFHELQKVSKL